MTAAAREVGRTAAAGWQIGVRRTLPVEPERLWELLRSDEGMAIWLGGPVELRPGAAYRLDDGTEGEVRIDEPGSHLRLTWRPPGWERASTVQVRVMAARTGTTLSFHQEHLAGPEERERMRERWRGVIGRLASRLVSA